MTATFTPFAGYIDLGPGDPLSSNGYYFQAINPTLADYFARVGAVLHRHDAHDAMANPTTAPSLSTATTGGTIPSGQRVYVTYTLIDEDGGESLPATVANITTATGYSTPTSTPTATPSYSSGSLLAGTYYYGVTVTDGAGGETLLGPPAIVTIPPGHASAEVTISGLTAITNASSGSSITAGWRLWRQQAGGLWYLIDTGPYSTDSFTDTAVAGDCTVQPPTQTTTHGTNTISVTVPNSTSSAVATAQEAPNFGGGVPVTIISAPVQASVTADSAPTLPLTITTSVNDQFVYTGAGGGGTPTTFTIAPGTYTTLAALTTAVGAALHASTAFSTQVTVTNDGTALVFTALTDVGAAGVGDTITEGNGGAAAIGVTAPPDTFSGGVSVNNTFQYAGDEGYGTVETFTIANGTYSTLAALETAVMAAIGSVSSEAFSTYVTVTDNGTELVFTDTYDVGGLGNGNIISEADALGISAPITFSGGSSTQPPEATNFILYGSTDGSFLSPARLGIYPSSDYGATITFTDLTAITSGSPPPVSRCLPGANKINPDTDIQNWVWKSPVDTFAHLPSIGNTVGDARETLDTYSIYIWNGTAWTPLTGPTGPRGSLWYVYAGVPPSSTPSSMQVGDLTVDSTNGTYYETTDGSTWTLVGELRGSQWYQSSGTPASSTPATMQIGDWDLDTTTGDVYLTTDGSTWTFQFNIAGVGTVMPQDDQTADYTLVLADAGEMVVMNSGSALTLTIPPNSAVAYPQGTVINVIAFGAGPLTIAGGMGVTLDGASLTSTFQFQVFGLWQVNIDEWVVSTQNAGGGGGPWSAGGGTDSAVLTGGGNTASGNYSVAEGLESMASYPAAHAHSGGLRATAGDAQYVRLPLAVATGGATILPTASFPANRTMAITGTVIAREDTGADQAIWTLTAAVTTDGSGVATDLITASATLITASSGAVAAGWGLTFSAGVITSSIGSDGRTISWVTILEWVELG